MGRNVSDPQSDNNAAGDLLRQAMTMHQKGRLDEADDLYGRVLDADPLNAQALRLRGILARESGDLDASLRLLKKSAEVNQQYPEPLCELALTLMQAGELQLADAALRDALARESGSHKALANLGALLQYRGHTHEAITYHRRALELDPSDVEVRCNLAKALADAGYGIEAIAECDSALTLFASHPFVLATKGSVLLDLEQYEGAAEILEQAVARDPDQDMALINLGRVRLAQGRHGRAAETLRRAVKVNPNNAWAVADLANVLAATDQRQEALRLCEQFLMRHSGERLVLGAYVYVLRDAGREDEARALYDFSKLIKMKDLVAPTGYKSREVFNQALASVIEGHPSLLANPLSRATRDGSQTGELDFDEHPALSALGAWIKEAVTEAANDFVGAGVADHSLMADAPQRWTIRVWGTVLKEGGHQTPHMHPLGWLSGNYYVQLPPDMGRAGQQAGWLEFGAPPKRYTVMSEPELYGVQPKEGRLVLFPSYFYHCTKPFSSSTSRISIAFDVVPCSLRFSPRADSG